MRTNLRSALLAGASILLSVAFSGIVPIKASAASTTNASAAAVAATTASAVAAVGIFVPAANTQTSSPPAIPRAVCLRQAVTPPGGTCAAAQAQAANTTIKLRPIRSSVSPDLAYGPSWIEFESSNKCADDPGYSTGNVRIDQWTCVNQTNEYWYLDYTGGDGPRVYNGYSHKCLNVSGASKSNGAFIIQYPCSNTLNMEWNVLDVLRNGVVVGYELQSLNSGKCVNVAGNSMSNGADLIQYTCGYYFNEMFYYPNWGF